MQKNYSKFGRYAIVSSGMKFAISVVLSLLITTSVLYANTYYVSNTGRDANPGTLALPWKTVTRASASTSPGDTIFVKAGLYNENVVISKSGTSDKPVIFIGYKALPGDAPPILVNEADPYSAFSSADMPAFDGGNRAFGTGFDCRNQKFLKIKNFQIQNYEYGLVAGGPSQDACNNYFFNINVMNIGNISASYSGYAILLGSRGTLFANNNIVDSCLAVNSAGEGISINGNKNSINGCKVYCNQNSAAAATDYYMTVTGNYNYFTNCFIERAPGLSHSGHGYSAKTNAEEVIDQRLDLPVIGAEHNVFSYCVARNFAGESFCVRHRGARFNLFYHCKAIGTYTGEANSTGGEGNGIVIRDGASDNIFDGCIAENCNSAILFRDTIEDGDTGSNPTGHPGNNNRIINCLIINCYIGVNYGSYSIPSDAGNNTIANCTFFKARYMFSAGRSCKNMKYVNNIFCGMLPSNPVGAFKTGAFADDIVPNSATTNFSNCNFYNIEEGMPANFVSHAINCISADPLFKNASVNGLHLLSGSPCINTGKALAFVKTDFDSIPRPQSGANDMGAYESQLITSGASIQRNRNFSKVSPNPTADMLYVQSSEPRCIIRIYSMSDSLIHTIVARTVKIETKSYGFENDIY